MRPKGRTNRREQTGLRRALKTIGVFLALWVGSSSLCSVRAEKKKFELPFDYTGFFDVRAGVRTKHDQQMQRDLILDESRLQLELSKDIDIRDRYLSLLFKADVLYDGVDDYYNIEVREANAAFDLTDSISLKAGRQILTWGTGDLIFINDLFPKDWRAFFIGRDEEYLKRPSDALKLSLYPSFASIDIVYTPQFDPDRFITGQRVSYYNPLINDTAGKRNRLRTDVPDAMLGHDSEIAVRVSK